MFSISNKHEKFFDYLMNNAKNFHRGAVIAKEVMKDVTSIHLYIKEVVKLEHTSDKINQDIIMKLCRVFITPIDREDFYKLTCHLEDCIDQLHGSLMRVSLYHLTKSSPAAEQIAEQLELMGQELTHIFALLKDIDKHEAELMERANRLSKMETNVDNIYRREISRIFQGDEPLLDVIRWKDILGTLEDASDAVEHLGNIIKEVTMKYA